MECKCPDAGTCDWKFTACGGINWMKSNLQYKWGNGFEAKVNNLESIDADVVRVWREYAICKAKVNETRNEQNFFLRNTILTIYLVRSAYIFYSKKSNPDLNCSELSKKV